MEKGLFSKDDILNDSKEVLRKRTIASAIDYFMLLLFTMFLPVFIGEKTGTGYQVHGVLSLLPLLFWFIYFVIIEKNFSGTLGKALVGIKVESLDGSNLKYIQILKRRLADFIEIVWCFGVVAYVNASNNAYNKRVGDVWANTRIINRDKEITV